MLAVWPEAMQDKAAGTPASRVTTVHCDRFGSATAPRLLILLHGVSGPGQFDADQEEFFAHHGFRVLLPHYLEAGHGRLATDENYAAWVEAVRGAIENAGDAKNTVIVGYSLGASVALALGSLGQGPDAIAELAGSLPDRYLRDLKGMPPLLILHGGRDTSVPADNALQLSRLCAEADLLCEQHIYPEQGHVLSPESLRDADRRILEFFSKIAAAGPG